jgi:hypothetical protein
MVAQRQFWLGPARAGQTVRFWASVDVIHLSIAGAQVKSLRSHFSAADLARLAHDGAVPAGPPPLPPAEDGAVIEVDRAVNNSGPVGVAGKQVLAAETLGGRPVIVRIEPATLMFLDPDTRQLLRVRPNPLTHGQALRLQGARPAGPPPRPRTEPVTVQRRVSATGAITVCRQPVARAHPPAAWSRSTCPSTRSRSARRRDPHRPPHTQPAGSRAQGRTALRPAPRP